MRGLTQNSAYFKGLTKKDYISKAIEIMNSEGIEAISIRRIAREMGCSSASLYRHFENLSELLYYAELHILSGYIDRLNEAEKDWKNIWDYYVGIWDCYSREAFRHPEEYNTLFFVNDNSKLNVSIKEYYEMFPDDKRKTNDFFLEMLETVDFMGRDFQICKKCVAADVITYEDAILLNRMACVLYEGYFKMVVDHGATEEEIDSWVEKYIHDLDWVVMNLATDLKGYQGYGK